MTATTADSPAPLNGRVAHWYAELPSPDRPCPATGTPMCASSAPD